MNDEPNISKSAQRVTVSDIAKAVGVSATAVSLALRNQNRVSEKLRLKIQAKAKEMGYRPDPMLTALVNYSRSGKRLPVTAELAWINYWPDPKALRAFREFESYWKGAFNEADKAGYRLEEFRLDADLRPERLEKILKARNIRGILLPPKSHDANPEWQNFPWDDFSIVRFGYSVQSPRVHIVASDQLSNGLLACQEIHKLGYQRLGLVTSVRSHIRFAAGYLFSQMQWDMEVLFRPLVLQQGNAAEDQEQLVMWLKKNRPDAIFTDVAELRGMLARASYRVPEDIGLAAYSLRDGNADAGIEQNSESIGRAALQLLVSLINHNERGIPEVCREVLVEGDWVNGSTLPQNIEG